MEPLNLHEQLARDFVDKPSNIRPPLTTYNKKSNLLSIHPQFKNVIAAHKFRTELLYPGPPIAFYLRINRATKWETKRPRSRLQTSSGWTWAARKVAPNRFTWSDLETRIYAVVTLASARGGWPLSGELFIWPRSVIVLAGAIFRRTCRYGRLRNSIFLFYLAVGHWIIEHELLGQFRFDFYPKNMKKRTINRKYIPNFIKF